MSAQSAQQKSELVLPVSDELPVLAKFGEYTIYPMEFCSEEQIAKLFSKVGQRGNPVLQGRPLPDLEQLGRAMYRKSKKMGMGNVAVYKGEPVALGCSWDMAEGGVWEGSGLEMPESMQAHNDCGKASFDTFREREKAESTFYSGFYGVAPPHSIALFGYLGFSNLCLAHMLGFEDSFQFTLIPALTKKGLWSGQGTAAADNMDWPIPFAEVPTNSSSARAELAKLDGAINNSLIRLGYMMGPDYQKMAAGICNMKAKQLFEPSQMIAENHLKWIRSRGKQGPASRL